MTQRSASSPPVIIFDGVCNLCNGFVNLIIRLDRTSKFKFVPLQSAKAQTLLAATSLPKEAINQLDSVIVLENREVWIKSDAVLKIASKLPQPWRVLTSFRYIPKVWRDRVYDFIAKNRYGWFGKKNKCMIPTPEIKDRFL